MTLQIYPVYELADMHAAVELQHTYWGVDAESVIPAHMLFSLATHGGHVLAAFDDDHMVGLLVGFIGTDTDYDRPAAANLLISSKRMVVLPEYRNQGLAYQMKLAQRDMAMQQAIRLVTWTFDPLLAPNAHLNIRKLGAICTRFRQNYYGVTGYGGLSVMGASDRLFVEWWVTNRRVKERVTGSREGLGLQQYLDADVPILNPSSASTVGSPWPAEQMPDAEGAMVLLEIPLDYPAIVEQDAALAQAWRLHIRERLSTLMDAGYVVTDFVRESYEGRDRGFYLLSHNAAVTGIGQG